MTVTVLTAAGTWAPWEAGYPADVGRALDNEWDHVYAELMGSVPEFRWQPIGYPAVGFLNPDPNTSYNESVAMGVTEGLRLLATITGEYDLIGYSQGAEVVVRIATQMLAKGRPPRRIVTFGSPCKPPGPTAVGNNPLGSGIARFYLPAELRGRCCDIVRDKGEMYGCALDDSYLPEFYALFVQAEVSIPFAAAALEWAMPYVAGGLGAVLTGNPFGLLKVVDLGKAINTARQLIDFASTNAHTSYHLPAPEFGGRTGLQVAIDYLAA